MKKRYLGQGVVSAGAGDMDFDFSSVEDLPMLQARAAFLAVDSEAVFRESGDITPVPIDDGLEYVPWGADNQMPYKVLRLIEEDETMTTCLQFNAELCYGSGLVFDTENCAADVKKQVKDFLCDNCIPLYYLGVCQDLKHYGFAVTVVVLNATGDRIVRVLRKNACYCRFEKAKPDGTIEHVLYAQWRNCSALERKDVEVIELLSETSPCHDLAVRMGIRPGDDGKKKMRTKARKFAILTKIPTADNTYYPVPFYASLFAGKWYDIKRLIALAKRSKLQNAAPLKYHIEVSNKYWKRLFEREGITDRKARQRRMVEEKRRIIDFLTGVENSGKVWFSMFYATPDGKEEHDVLINKVDDAKEGGDWESDIQEAVNMMCFALRVHSNLVGSVPGKSQSNNSGSDKRELYTISQALQKPYHDLLFLAPHTIAEFNGWENCKIDCPFIQLTTLDEKKDAKEVSPNSDNKKVGFKS